MESNKKKLGNKGFSLVELIVVIAIMAILIGIIAPNLMGYIERTNISADIQLADTIRTAVKTAMMDPVVLSDKNGSAHVDKFKNATSATSLADLVKDPVGSSGVTSFGKTITEILGEDNPAKITSAWVTKHIRSKISKNAGASDTMDIEVLFKDNDVIVTITHSDNGNGDVIKVP